MTNNNIIIDAKLDLDEALELIEISRGLFQKRLEEIKAKSKSTTNHSKLYMLEVEAQKLYEDYKKSLSAIEDYIDEAANMNRN